MVQFRRYGSFQTAGTGEQALGSTLMAIGSDIMEEIERQKAQQAQVRLNADKAAYDVQSSKFENELSTMLYDTRNEPELAISKFETFWSEREKQFLSIATTEESKEFIKNKVAVDKQDWIGQINAWAQQQYKTNDTVNYRVALDNANRSVTYMPEAAGQQQIIRNLSNFLQTQKGFYDSRNINGMTEETMKADYLGVARNQFSSYLLQHGTPEHIDNPNAFVDEVTEKGFKEPLFGPEEITGLKKLYETQQNRTNMILEEQRKKKHDANARELLSRLWDKNPENNPTPQQIADMIKNDEISVSIASKIMDDIGSPKQFDLGKLAEVNEALLKYQTDPSFENKQEALTVLAKNANYLGDEGKSKLNELYSDISRIDAAEKREAYSNMAQLLGGTPDPTDILSFAFGNPQEKDAWIKATMEWDEAVKKAISAGKPLDTTQKRYKAVEIARRIKQEMAGKTGAQILPLPTLPLKPEEFAEYTKTAKLEAGKFAKPKKTEYKMGDIITKAGKRWKIVDFDTDGTPLVESE